MEIESISHKALRRFVETGQPRGLPGDLVDRLFRMVNFVIDTQDFSGLAIPPNYGFHPLVGDRIGTYAMSVTRNWRLTFTKVDEATIANLDLEDYH